MDGYYNIDVSQKGAKPSNAGISSEDQDAKVRTKQQEGESLRRVSAVLLSGGFQHPRSEENEQNE